MRYEDAARKAVVAALRVRTTLGRRLDEPVCPFAIAEALGLKVRFEPLPSLEGLYFPDEPLVVIGSLRPKGRRAYTCGHEIGHHVLGHGLRVDQESPEEATTSTWDEAEFSADRFSTALLMPKLAVENAFSSRRWSIERCGPRHLYTIAGLLGVGYTTLIGYLERTLRLLSASAAQRLRIPLPKVRKTILGFEPSHDLLVVDEAWTQNRDLDVEVGDLVTLPPGAEVEGDAVRLRSTSEIVVFEAVHPGVAQVRHANWTAPCRVARRGYRGLNAHRHLEDPEHEE